MRLLCIFAMLYAAMLPSSVLARPVSYPDGWTYMQMNDADAHSLHVHYSPTAKYSVGYKGEYWRKDDWQFHGLQLNYLAKRWNQKASQANIYVKTAAGLSIDSDGNTAPAAYTGIAADWESRRFFTSYANRITTSGEESFFMQKARVGIAPYIGDYGDLHTWLMFQVDHQPEQQNHFRYTPMVRLFKGPTLAEFGISTDGDVLANLVIRF